MVLSIFGRNKLTSIMKNKIKRKLHKKFHCANRKRRKTKRKYYSEYTRNKKNRRNNPPQQHKKKSVQLPKREASNKKTSKITESLDLDVKPVKDVIPDDKISATESTKSNKQLQDKATELDAPIKSVKSTAVIEIPEKQILVGYHMVYGEPIPITREERLNLIKHIPKEVIIHNIASINYLQREFNSFTYTISDELQWANLSYWLNTEKSEVYKSLIYRYFEEKKLDATPVIFNRAANLFSIQEVIYYGAELEYEEGFNEGTIMEDVFKYYLSVNNKIGDGRTDLDTNKFTDIQKLAASNLFIDMLHFANNPVFILERYPELIEYLHSKPELNELFANYFKPYGYDPEQMLKYIAELYFNLPKKEQKYLAPFIDVPTDDPERNKILDSISKLQTDIEPEHDFDLTRLKKSPLYKIPNKWYIILDHDFLIQKLYQFAINDYFFDYLKPNTNVNYPYYAAEIGLFFENYVSGILKKSFKKHNVIIKTLDELKTKKPGSEMELADFYIRKGNDIILGQVKASALNTEQNRGTAESLYSDKKDFLGDFGVKQTFETIQYLKKYPEEFDDQIKEDETYNIYPIIVLNEAITASLPICLLFNDEFKNMLTTDAFPNFQMRYITLLHIQDIERIAPSIEDGSFDFWDILDISTKDSIPKPFEITLDRLNFPQVHSMNAKDYKFMKFANYNKDIL